MTDEEKLEEANCPTCGQPVYIHISDEGTGCYLPRPAQVEGDIRGEICRITSKMLDNPDEYGIYPTTVFYDEMEQFIRNLLAKRQGGE